MKAENVIDILSGNINLVDFCRANGSTQSAVQRWIDGFKKADTQGIKSKAKQKRNEIELENDELKEVIRELTLHNHVLKKASM